MGLLVQLCFGRIIAQGRLVAESLKLLVEVGGVLPVVVLETLEISQVDVLLPTGGEPGHLLTLQEDVGPIVAGFHFIALVFVLAGDEVALFWVAFVGGRRSALVREGHRWDVFAAHHQRRVFKRLWLFAPVHYYYIASL